MRFVGALIVLRQLLLLQHAHTAHSACSATDSDGDGICDDVDSCPFDSLNDVEGDGVCTQCCGAYLGPNGGASGEYEIQVDLKGVSPGVVGTSTAGTWTIQARIYVTSDWDGTASILHSRSWDSSGSEITSIGGDSSTSIRDQWTTVQAAMNMGTRVPYRMSVYFGYPMQNTKGWIYLDDLQVLDPAGKNWVPNNGKPSCTDGFFEGQYHGVGDSYGSFGILPNACEYDGFSIDNIDNCNDMDSDDICTPDDSCMDDAGNDADGDGFCEDMADISINAANIKINTADIANLQAAVAVLVAASAETPSVLANGVSGADNAAMGEFSVVAGGKGNTARSKYSGVLAGFQNEAGSNYAVVAGGFNNRATGRFAAVPGGSSNIASGRHSAALGSFGTAKFDYSVVINGLGTPCAAESASEVRLCGNSLLFETPTGEVVDLLAGVARRSLSERAKEVEERRQTAAVIEALQAETAALRRQVDALVAAAAGAA